MLLLCEDLCGFLFLFVGRVYDCVAGVVVKKLK